MMFSVSSPSAPEPRTTPGPGRTSRALRAAVACALACAALTGLAGVVQAQPAVEAQALYERGVRLYAERELESALDAMLASNRLVPNAGVTFNAAQIYDLLDRPTEAFNWYRRYLLMVGAPEDRQRGEARMRALRDRVALVDVEATPPGALLFLDRVELGAVGQAPTELAVQPGAHRMIAQAPGFAPAIVAFEATLGETRALALELERLTGTLAIDSRPAGARVLVDGSDQLLGMTPLSARLPVGATTLRLEHDGYLPARLPVVVQEGRNPVQHAALERDREKLAQLTLRSDPAAEANVTGRAAAGASGRMAAPTPLVVQDLEPGTYSLRVSRPGHVPWEQRLDLLAGLSTEVDVTLSERVAPPWEGWAYLGYGGGAVLLGSGIAVGVSAVVARNDGERDVQARNNLADALMLSGVVALAATWVLTDLLVSDQRPSRARVTSRALHALEPSKGALREETP